MSSIVSGISAGDSVVIEGADRLRDGMHVDIRHESRGRRSAVIPALACHEPLPSFILRPVATSLLMAAILLVGIVAYRQLPVSALPEVDYPTIEIVTLYPGAAPDVMASSVTAPLERQFGQIPGLKQMTSTSSFGSSVVTLQFDLKLDIDVAEQEVQAAINAARRFLPADLPNPPIYTKSNPADAPILTLALTSSTLPLPQVRSLADTRLAPKISQLPGVGLVTISGGQKPAVRVRANPTALAAYDLSLEDVRSAIAAGEREQAKGIFDGAAPGLHHRRQRSAVVEQGLSTGHRGLSQRRSGSALGRGGRHRRRREHPAGRVGEPDAGGDPEHPAAARRQHHHRRRQHQGADAAADSVPASAINVSILTDRTTTIRASVHDVQFELMLTVGLVVMVIFLFLRRCAPRSFPASRSRSRSSARSA